MSDDSVSANASVVRKLRQKLGWTQEDLARKVGCAKRTIENVEAGNPIRRQTLWEVAQALDTAPERLQSACAVPCHDGPAGGGGGADAEPRDGPREADQTGGVAVAEGTVMIELIIKRDFDSFSAEEQDRLLSCVRELLLLFGDIRVLSKRRGSVVLTLELSSKEAELLCEAVNSGKLTHLGVAAARKVDVASGGTEVESRHGTATHLRGGAPPQQTSPQSNVGPEPRAAMPLPQLEAAYRLLIRRNQELERREEDLQEQLREHKLTLERRVAERTRELEDANVQLQRALAEMDKLALTDPLTGLLNRQAIQDIAARELRRHARYRGHMAVGIIDVDHFKHINDKYLYPGGDFVLVHLTRVLSGLLRTVDSIGRIGGEEFLVVAPETAVEGAGALAERIRETVERTPFVYNGATIPVRVSVGFAVAEPDSGADYKRLNLLASNAVHEAKAAGRNRAVIHLLGKETVIASHDHMRTDSAS